MRLNRHIAGNYCTNSEHVSCILIDPLAVLALFFRNCRQIIDRITVSDACCPCGHFFTIFIKEGNGINDHFSSNDSCERLCDNCISSNFISISVNPLGCVTGNCRAVGKLVVDSLAGNNFNCLRCTRLIGISRHIKCHCNGSRIALASERFIFRCLSFGHNVNRELLCCEFSCIAFNRGVTHLVCSSGIANMNDAQICICREHV